MKNGEGSCGSCWAVTAATLLEAHAELHGRRRSFAVQELLDCVLNPLRCGGQGGCQGATVELAMSYAMHLGLAEAAARPYGRPEACGEAVAALELSAEAQHGEALDRVNQSAAQRSEDRAALRFLHQRRGGKGLWGHAPRHRDLSSVGVRPAAADALGRRFGLVGWQRLPANGEAPLRRALVERGPVGVSVAAGRWHLYHSGVFDYCAPDAVIDHAVTLIGFGRESAEKWWLIQNSWGSRWGEGGRIRLLREDESRCGWDRQPQKGDLDHPLFVSI